MSTKSSQLQIRISPEQKDALRLMASDAGMSVSEYVLSRVLPTGQVEFDRRVRALGSSRDRQGAFTDLLRFLDGVPATEIGRSLAVADLDEVPSVLRNYVAGAVEAAAWRSGASAPAWTAEVEPPERPHFTWELRSLRPHLMRVSPVAFKRRNVFVALGDEAGPFTQPAAEPRDEAERRFQALGARLEAAGVEAEACLVGGAVLTLVFAADPPSRRPRDLFGPLEAFDRAAAGVAERMGLERDWLGATVRGYVERPGIPGRFYGGRRLGVYAAPPGYVLATLCAHLTVAVAEEASRLEADVAYLLRFLDLRHAADAMAAVARYLTERQHPPDLEARFAALLAPPRPATGG